jgi:predicted DNA-binding transcriptional regulator AlpA
LQEGQNGAQKRETAPFVRFKESSPMSARKKASTKPAFITKTEVMRRLGIGDTTLRKLIKAGHFPPGVPAVPGGRALGWLDSVVDAYQAERLSLLDAGPVELPPVPPPFSKRDDDDDAGEAEAVNEK